MPLLLFHIFDKFLKLASSRLVSITEEERFVKDQECPRSLKGLFCSNSNLIAKR